MSIRLFHSSMAVSFINGGFIHQSGLIMGDLNCAATSFPCLDVAFDG
jgi:hypothetical protein